MANDPITREEMLLNAVATGVSSGIEPITREEMYLAYIGGQDVIPPEPITRKEQFLSMIAPGGGSGVVIRNQDKTITENGTYTADVGYTGLGNVTVAVPIGGGGDLLQYARSVATLFFFPFGNTDTLPFETLVVNAPLSTSNYNFFKNKDVMTGSAARPHGVKKIILTVDVIDMSAAGGIIDGVSDIEEIEIHANNSENVSAERRQFAFAPSLKKISGIKLNGSSSYWTVTSNLNTIWLPTSALEEVRFVPNSMSYNGTYQLGQHSKLSDDSLASIANAMDASGSVNVTKTIKLHADVVAKLPNIMGTAADGVFALDSSGSTTLLDFITQTKGWTVS